MSALLLWPAALFGLFALLLPILLHLRRREQHRLTRFAALRWLAGAPQAQRRARIERPLLLALRLLLLAACVLLLAQPIWRGSWGSSRDWVLLVPGVDLAAARAAYPDSQAEWHWLARDFPAVEVSIDKQAQDSASLLRELDTRLPEAASIRVVSGPHLSGLDGERIHLSRPVDWTILPVATAETPIDAAPVPIHVAVGYADPDDPALRYVRAAMLAWNTTDPQRYSVRFSADREPVAADTNWLLWLSTKRPAWLEAWIDHGGSVLWRDDAPRDAPASWVDPQGRVIARIQRRGQGRVIDLAVDWIPAQWPELYEADFPQRLMQLFTPPQAEPDRAMSGTALIRTNSQHKAPALTAMDPALLWLIALLFVAERALASWRPRQGAQRPVGLSLADP